MSRVSLKLVQNRSFAASSDDLAMVLVFSVTGMISQLLLFAMGLSTIA
jgi:hypothetical protein